MRRSPTTACRCWKISVDEKMASRNKLRQLLQNAAEIRAGLCLHPRHAAGPQQRAVARPARAGASSSSCLRQRNETAVLFTLSTEVPARRRDDIRRMEARLPLAGRPSRRPARSVRRRSRVLPGRAGVQRPEPERQSRLHQPVRLRAEALRQPHAGRHGIHGHPQRLRRRVRPEHLRAVRHRPGRADQLRRDLRLHQRLRLRRFRRESRRRRRRPM